MNDYVTILTDQIALFKRSNVPLRVTHFMFEATDQIGTLLLSYHYKKVPKISTLAVVTLLS